MQTSKVLITAAQRFQFLVYKIYGKLFSKITIKCKGKSFEIGSSTPNEVHRAFTFNTKEPETLEWIDGFKSYSSDGSFVFFDIGANIGVYSLYTAVSYPNSRVLSFEPDAQSFSALSKNIFKNNLKISAYPFAISDCEGVGSVYISSMKSGAGACALGGAYRFSAIKKSQAFEQGIYFTSLDDLVFAQGFPVPNFIKLDVDGIEGKIIVGAEKVLRNDKCQSVLVEIQGGIDATSTNYIDNFLKDCGFALVNVSDWEASYNDLVSRNYIYAKISLRDA